MAKTCGNCKHFEYDWVYDYDDDDEYMETACVLGNNDLISYTHEGCPDWEAEE